MWYFFLKLVVLAATFGFTTSESQLAESSPYLSPQCFYGEGGYIFTKYTNATLELDGLCDESAIDERDLEYAITDYFNSYLECILPEDRLIPLPEQGGLDRIICYPAVLISGIKVTENSLSNCKLEVLTTTEVGLEEVAEESHGEDDPNVGSGRGICGDFCATNNYLPSGGSFRRNRLRRRLRGINVGVKSSESSKPSKATDAQTNDVSTNDYRELIENQPHCGSQSFISYGFDVTSILFKESVETSVCETKFACIRDPCTKPGGDICDGIL